MKLLFGVTLAVFSLLNFGHAAGPAVLVKHNDQYHGFMQLPRISEVLTRVNSQAQLYWPAARLYKTDDEAVAELEQQRQALLQRLEQLQLVYTEDDDTEFVQSAKSLAVQVKSWTLAKQLLLVLDPERVRTKAQLNPRLWAGFYSLQVQARPETVSVTGLAKNSELPLLEGAEAADYADLLQFHSGASSSFIYILPAQQKPLLAQIGLWNKKRQDVPAGAVLFVPFEQRLLPAEFENLNQQIVELLQHRVVL
ncbi:hypothetical protein EIK76_03295 [Rheinheimera mesophila]|uniref:Uncharacterized protein n=1 Tax=Rheinheimera mesophila TaxID=1547515 RepID=A0A3P3QQ25_9GAMM|nr:capsule biosynthesis GfcC family protein [Rheinheimera mesophila]KKL00418.1 hypothetical protein SD53_14790 [Rheinheimera mesophila]RRJ23125.1 hypothetical protein EIK76_03295 [Rheinheimera mesophila]